MDQQLIKEFAEDYLHCGAFCNEMESYEFSVQAMFGALEDCEQFIVKAGSLLDGLDMEQAADDFWYTRNGHGTGFWDREDIPEDKRESLTELAKSFGESYLYLENKVIYLE